MERYGWLATCFAHSTIGLMSARLSTDRSKRELNEKIEPVFREIECWAMAVPNTVSAIIVGLGIPSQILEDQRTTTRPVPTSATRFRKTS